MGSLGIPLGSGIADSVGSSVDGTPNHRDQSHDYNYNDYNDDY